MNSGLIPPSDPPNIDASSIDTPSVLPGIKLPKTDSEWEEANLYFCLNFDISVPISNIDDFAMRFQQMIYSYFKNMYGVVKSDDMEIDKKYENRTVKELKKELKELKTNLPNSDQIKHVSKLIRNKLKPRPAKQVVPPKSNIGFELKSKFWKTCKNVFNYSGKISPSFTTSSCFKYFKQILKLLSMSRKFVMPSWIPKLALPVHPCLTTPPTYAEITKAINKSKSRASPCPFDQISVIALKRCAILRTILHKLITECWNTGTIPTCWKRGLTILIYKKGDPKDPSNFRPITLQPVLYKILASFLRNRLHAYLENNNFVDKHVQKGFWPTMDGVSEHTEMLTQLLRDAKLNQRSINITLLDLKNAFGEVSHDLITSALEYHHVPNEIIKLIQNIYTNSMISVAVGNQNTSFIPVERGVLQGDPCSPLLFNMTFNPLMRMITQPKYEQFGYIWSPNVEPKTDRSWMQFADDTAIISSDVSGAQALLGINIAWCRCTGMQLRTDKCSTFGMRKQDGKYIQYKPNFSIGDEYVPVVNIGESFTYLGKHFDFNMDNQKAKQQLKDKLTFLLRTTSGLDIKPQQKLEILKKFIPTQLSFELRIHDFSYTWIEQTLDSLIGNAVRDWMTFPISTCVKEIPALPKNQGGFDIPSQKSVAQRLRLTQRYMLKFNKSEDIRKVWSVTSLKNVNLDELISQPGCKKTAMKYLMEKQEQQNFDHISMLKIQGEIVRHLKQSTTKSVFERMVI